MGLDEGGATIEGLELAAELFDEPFVFYDRATRTFHPKLYVVEGDHHATAVIGSGNMTRGGLYTNYECATVFELDTRETSDAAFLAELRSYFDALLALPDACKRLTPEFLAQVIADPTFAVRSESTGRGGRATGSQASGQPHLFGSLVTGLRGAPPAASGAGDDDDTDSREPTDTSPTPPPPGAGPTSPPAPQPNLPGPQAFFKALSKNDVSLVGSPGQIIIPIRFLPFFGELQLKSDETATGGPRMSDADLTVLFRDGAYSTVVGTARVILYEPAANHPRQNSEVRFTFRDRELLTRLSADDVLAFSRNAAGEIVIERHGAGWLPAGVTGTPRYEWF
jgi:hypothetical protein